MRDQELIDRHIDTNFADRADARVRDYGVHVWAIVGQMRAANGNLQEVAEDYQVPHEVVQVALAYYRRNKDYRVLHRAWHLWPLAFGTRLPAHNGILAIDQVGLPGSGHMTCNVFGKSISDYPPR